MASRWLGDPGWKGVAIASEFSGVTAVGPAPGEEGSKQDPLAKQDSEAASCPEKRCPRRDSNTGPTD